MADDPNQPVVLTTTPTEVSAAMIVAALENQGVVAHTTGALTSGFLAAVPGEVQILVRQADLAQAREALRTIEPGPDSDSDMDLDSDSDSD